MGKFGSGILDGKNVSKITKLKGIHLPGSVIRKQKFLQLFFPAVSYCSDFFVCLFCLNFPSKFCLLVYCIQILSYILIIVMQ